ncbi:MAG: hypothetical protein LBT46_11030, partial [Planctomycetaceae bacterium]|nr:hypothetical protein [Planctomycetaceae bacterium]
ERLHNRFEIFFPLEILTDGRKIIKRTQPKLAAILVAFVVLRTIYCRLNLARRRNTDYNTNECYREN